MRKGEIAYYKQFLLFLTMFSTAIYLYFIKMRHLCGNELKSLLEKEEIQLVTSDFSHNFFFLFEEPSAILIKFYKSIVYKIFQFGSLKFVVL